MIPPPRRLRFFLSSLVQEPSNYARIIRLFDEDVSGESMTLASSSSSSGANAFQPKLHLNANTDGFGKSLLASSSSSAAVGKYSQPLLLSSPIFLGSSVVCCCFIGGVTNRFY